MVWVTWRQHRLALAGVVALFGAAAAYLLVTGLPMHDAYPAVAGCRPAGSDLCNKVVNDFLRTYAPGVGVTFGLLQAIPALIGAFAGAPLLITGRYRGAPQGGIRLSALCGGEPWSTEVRAWKDDEAPLDRVWARGRVRELEDRYVIDRGESAKLESEIVQTSLMATLVWLSVV